MQKVYGSGRHAVPALRGVSLDLQVGETLGLVGESGCGKSTLARIVVGLTRPTGGAVNLDGADLSDIGEDRDLRRRVQMVFQHPEQSLNRRFRVAAIVGEPLRLLRGAGRVVVDQQVDEALRLVGLGPEYRDRRPSQLSGGQQQRVAIARALIPEPDLVVLDEPTSSLDQSVRARILALLRGIQAQRRVAFLFISHDLTTVRRIASRVAVMYLGRLVEVADTETLFTAPQHPYTHALLSAVPSMNPRARKPRTLLTGEPPNPASLPPGCSFQNRCPLVHDRCRREEPRLLPCGPRHLVECFAVPPEGVDTRTAGGDPHVL